MTTYEVNGKKITVRPSISKFQKTVHQIKTEIIKALGRVGITPEYISLPTPRNELKRDEPANICWYVNGDKYFYKCDTQRNYRDNLGVIGKLVEIETYAIRNGLKSFAQVMNQFRLGYSEDMIKIKTPRDILGVPEDVNDIEYVKFRFKQLSKDHHPDSGGDAEKFKEIIAAKDELLKELEQKEENR